MWSFIFCNLPFQVLQLSRVSKWSGIILRACLYKWLDLPLLQSSMSFFYSVLLIFWPQYAVSSFFPGVLYASCALMGISISTCRNISSSIWKYFLCLHYGIFPRWAHNTNVRSFHGVPEFFHVLIMDFYTFTLGLLSEPIPLPTLQATILLPTWSILSMRFSGEIFNWLI